MKSTKAPLIFGIVMVAALAAYITMYKSSPGDLAEPHMRVAGSSFIGDCNKCHAKRGIPAGCMKCHLEIRSQLEASSGFHGKMKVEKRTECARCHSEHNGRGFPLVNQVSWEGKDPKTFKHSHADYRLNGKHEPLACSACHEKFAKPFALADFPKFPRTRTYLGLTQACVRCHKDVHAAGLAADCLKCHGQTAFKPTAGFDHEKIYPLTLGHSKRECKSCHILPSPGAPVPLPAPKGYPFDRSRGSSRGKTKAILCVECHKNPHSTKFKRECESCHGTTAVPWAEANKRTDRAAHALTGFRLIKPHEKMECAKCHDPKLPVKQRYVALATGTMRSERDCELCHRDEHRGQFLATRPRCMECHSLSVFKPSTYSVEMHRKTAYALTGGHVKAACNACHVKDPATKARLYVKLRQDCAYCHNDVHYGQFLVQRNNRCENCHLDTRQWKKTIFNHNVQSRYALDTAHVKVACKECHPMVTLPNGKRTAQYKPLRMKCEDCHEIIP